MVFDALWAVDLTGGGTGAADKIPTAELADKDIVVVPRLSDLQTYIYAVDDDLGGSETSPSLLKPDDESGNKRLTLLGITLPNTGLRLLDTNASNFLNLKWNENDTGNRTLNLLVSGGSRTLDLSKNLKVLSGQDIELHASGGEKAQFAIDTQNAERTLDLSGDLTVEANAIVSQDYSSDGSPTFATLTLDSWLRVSDYVVAAGGLKVGSIADPDGDLVVDTDVRIANHNGSTIGLKLGGTLVTAIGTEINTVADGSTAKNSHTHTYLPLGGGTMSGDITLSGYDLKFASGNLENGIGGIQCAGNFYPSTNSKELGNSGIGWATVYYHALSDLTCAYMGDYSIQELYKMFSQMRPVKDKTLHHSTGSNKYYPHTDFASLPEEFAWKAETDIESELPAFNQQGKIIQKTRNYKKGQACGIDRTVQGDALIALVIKMYEKLDQNGLLN